MSVATSLLPLVVALAVLAVPGRANARWVGVAGSLAVVVFAAIMVARYDSDKGGIQFDDSAAWMGDLDARYHVGVDGTAIWLILMTAVITSAALLWNAFRPLRSDRTFVALLLVTEAAVLSVFTALDLILFYVAFEVMLIPLYFLIGLWGDARASVRFVIYTLAGSLLMLAGIIGTYVLVGRETGTYTFDIPELVRLIREQGALTGPQQDVLFLLMSAAFLVKVPVWPFHGWLPGAYLSSPTPLVMVLSAVVSKVGVFGFLHTSIPLFPGGTDYWREVIAVLAVVGILYGSLLAFRHPTLTGVIAFSSLAHLGFITVGVMSLNQEGTAGAVFQMVNHGVVSAALFAIAGVLAERRGSDALAALGGLSRPAPVLAGVFLVFALANLAVPGAATFTGEFLILTGAWDAYTPIAIAASVGIVAAAMYMLRAFQFSMEGPEEEAEERPIADMRRREYAVLAPLLACAAVLTVVPRIVTTPAESATTGPLPTVDLEAGRPAAEPPDAARDLPDFGALDRRKP
jgi:NADH-quinone oxidoreductase subunit M